MTHTPGPWHIVGYTTGGAAHINCGRRTIATVYPPRTAHGTGESTANAALIAAAPELLEALKDLTALYASTSGHDPNFVKKGQHAIKKAEGNQ